MWSRFWGNCSKATKASKNVTYIKGTSFISPFFLKFPLDHIPHRKTMAVVENKKFAQNVTQQKILWGWNLGMTAHLPKKDFESVSYENLSFKSISGLRQSLFGFFGRFLSFSQVLELSEYRTVKLRSLCDLDFGIIVANATKIWKMVVTSKNSAFIGPIFLKFTLNQLPHQ